MRQVVCFIKYIYMLNNIIYIILIKGRYIAEKEFIDKFNSVRLLDKNKEIKFFQCIGD